MCIYIYIYTRRQYLLDLVEHKEQSKLENQVKALQAKLAAAQESALKKTIVIIILIIYIYICIYMYIYIYIYIYLCVYI